MSASDSRSCGAEAHLHPKVSLVLPCLNEAATLGLVIDEIHASMRESEFAPKYEVVVADNGSSDGSVDIALAHGARVVHVGARGYGAALQGGIASSDGDVVVMLDADYTYDAAHAPDLVRRLTASDDAMVIGTRLHGRIDRGAMPAMHRYVGTPVLTWLINRLFGATVGDCNSGMRAFHKSRFDQWGVRSPGMEFASEMIVACLASGDRIGQVPIHLRRDPRDRTPHLRRWLDGMRHLLLILSRAPRVFTRIGEFLILLTSLLAAVSAFGPYRIGPVSVFGYHAILFAILVGFFGAQSVSHGLVLEEATGLRTRLGSLSSRVREDRLFWGLLGVFFLNLALLMFLATAWVGNGFRSLAYLTPSLLVVYVVTVVGSVWFGMFHAHLVKRVAHVGAQSQEGR